LGEQLLAPGVIERRQAKEYRGRPRHQHQDQRHHDGAEQAVGQALEEYFLRYGWSWFPVIDEAGRFVGIARQERVQAAVDSGEGWLTVGAVLEATEAINWRVDEDRPIVELLASEPLGRLGALMAVDREGVLRGVVTVEQVRRALQSAFGSPVA